LKQRLLAWLRPRHEQPQFDQVLTQLRPDLEVYLSDLLVGLRGNCVPPPIDWFTQHLDTRLAPQTPDEIREWNRVDPLMYLTQILDTIFYQ
jgi:hypothetical protein